jgi:4-amino-4-deoxy-L-arabinose transferase-like glycosyltransferase
LPAKRLLAFLIAATAIRLAVAAIMPVSADEAYYWVWSRALAPGYLDHPPMVALWIRAGTLLAGQTPIGLRLLAPIAALAGSLLLWSAGRDLAPSHPAGRIAVYLLNATLLLNAGAVVITPDTPLLFFWVACLAALARLARTQNGLWLLAAGLAAGLAMDSKYTAILLLPATAAWLALTPAMRPWLLRWHTPAALAVAAAAFAPVIAWNAAHAWASFAKQGARGTDWHPLQALRFLAELAAGQAGLATPLVLLVMAAATITCARRWRSPPEALAAAMVIIPAAVFLQHALGGRVQANWPGIIYPGAALAAGLAAPRFWRPAAALGLGLVALVYTQATADPFRLPRRLDFALIRLAAWPNIAQAAQKAAGQGFVAADEYGLASELAWHLPGPVYGVEPRWQLFALPAATPSGQGILVRSTRRAGPPPWPGATAIGTVSRAAHGVTAETYVLYRVQAPPGPVALLPVR